MVLKNLIKARVAQPVRLSEDDRLVRSGLLSGLEALPTAVLVLDRRTLKIAFANPPAEALLDISRRQLAQTPWGEIFPNAEELATTITAIGEERFHATHLDTLLDRFGHEPLHVHAIVGFLESAPDYVVVELFENERQSRTDSRPHGRQQAVDP
jgi:two-component system, NtrC family, nitrogen regulation sensor histidine kinase GlnL